MIYVWPNGDWCWASDFDSYSRYRPGDWYKAQVPEWCDDEDAQGLADLCKREGVVDSVDVAKWFEL